jgi:uncharacterized membrane protein YdjX (TVP38/TMEM64 family)
MDDGRVRSTELRAGLLVVLVGVGAALALIVDLPDVAHVRSWLDGAGGVGWLVLVAGVALILLTPVPRAAVSALAGLVVGLVPGVAVSLAGGLIAAIVAFGLSRLLGRPALARLGGRRMNVVDRLLSGRGFTAVLAGRLLPVVPFVVLSYGAGLTAIRPGVYLLASAIGMLPGTVVQVGIGVTVGELAPWAWTAAAVVLVLAVLGTLARRRIPVPSR